MNRLSNWIRCAQLAKLHLNQAREDLRKRKLERAAGNLAATLDTLIAGMNNLAYIAFDKKPRKVRRPRRPIPVYRKYLGPTDGDLIRSLAQVKAPEAQP